MLFKTVNYQNALKKNVTKELFFNMNAMEQFELESRYLSKEFDTMEKFMQHVSDEKLYNVLVDFIKDLVLTAYGVPDENPESQTYGELLKTEKVKLEFENSFAYAEVFADLFQNQDNLLKFVQAVQYKTVAPRVEDIN